MFNFFRALESFFNGIVSLINFVINFFGSVAQTISTIFNPSLYSSLNPIFTIGLSISLAFTIYYFVRGSK